MSKTRLALLTALGLSLAACGGDAAVTNLFLRVSSAAPAAGGRLDALRVLFVKDGARFPAVATDPEFNPTLGDLDPVAEPVILSVRYDGATFGDGRGVTLEVTGRQAGVPVTRFEGVVDVAADAIIAVRLTALGSACDADGDGFVDCSVSGCCSGDSALSDCAPSDASANPWGSEPECEPCSDTVDQDCSGGDQPCVDLDHDEVADCSEIGCVPDDPDVAPGFVERCDGKDNDCNGGTDDGLTFNYQGKTLGKGDACGQGVCAGGTVVCDGAGGLTCSTDALREPDEICGNGLDDDCNGATDQGCPADDLDGDGFVAPQDCDEHDSGQYPGRPGEPCCPAIAEGLPAAVAACDLDCDGDVTFCDAADEDGDGVTAAQGDCDDSNPTIHPSAPEKCGDGVDQDCFAGDLDCAGVTDADHDGWAAADDCNDQDADIRPDAVETCNGKDDDCDGFVDDGNPDAGGSCGTDEGECTAGVSVCRNGGDVHGQVVCVGAIGGPETEAACDGKDDDCDGETDEDFVWQGLAPGDDCDGTGACGVGHVECAPGRDDLATCSTDPDGSDPRDVPEVCNTLDDDCDGDTNEGLTAVADSTCERRGVCGAHVDAIVASCSAAGTWSCDYSAVAGYEAGSELSCDGLDNDCDGGTDDEFLVGSGCDGSDPDACANGHVKCDPADATKTVCDESQTTSDEVCDGLDNDCDGQTDEDFKRGVANTVVLTGAALAADNGKTLGESCGTGACGAGVVACNAADRTKLACDTPVDATIETCNDDDDDCDGATDEPFTAGGTVKYDGGPYAADANKPKGGTCGTGSCAGGTVVCGGADTLTCSTISIAHTETCDGHDDDCDGQTDEGFPNLDGDTLADCVDPDLDGDGHDNADDNCPNVPNPSQSDLDQDDLGDACDPCTDGDLDGWGRVGTDQSGCSQSGDDCDDTNALDPDHDNRCGQKDNCPDVANPTQADADGDDIGDACDTCTDGDLDGYGRAGFTRTGCAQAAVDCDDTNATDGDHDNRCGVSDNCPAVANADQANQDGDAFGDACDTCTDADGDGFGRSGLPLTGCSGSTSEVDCNDTAQNAQDGDHDNVCFTGGRAVCTGGNRANCDDNCPNALNVDQADLDGDLLGDVCDPCILDADGDGVCDFGGTGVCTGGATTNCRDNCPGFVNPPQTDLDSDGVGDACEEPFEVCGDCTDNDSSAATTDLGAGCVERRHVTIQAGPTGIGAGYAVSMTFDHAFLVAAGRSLASGADVRVYWRDPDTHLWTQLDRVLDPQTAWNTTTTTIWFDAQAPIEGGTSDSDYRLVTGPSAPATAALADERKVFWAADLFDRSASTSLGSGWTESEDTGATVEIATTGGVGASGSSLLVKSADNDDRPAATLAFPAMKGGLWLWRIGWNMVNSSEGTYAVFMQLGSSAAGFADPPPAGAIPNGGVGPDLVWTGGATPFGQASGANLFMAEQGTSPALALGTLNARANIDVVVDLDQGLWNADPAGTSTRDALDFTTPTGQLDRMRIVTKGLTTSNLTRAQIDYVTIRPLVADGIEPFVYLGAEEPNACALNGTPLLRYRLDDPLGTDPVADTGSGTALGLDLTTSSIDYSCASGTCTLVQPYLADPGGQGSLGWDFQQRGGRGVAVARSGGVDTKLRGLDKTATTTFEMVIWLWEVPTSGRVTLAEIVQSNGTRQLALTLSGPPSAPTIHGWVKGADVGTWTFDPVLGGRMVLTLVYDSGEPNASEIRLYRDGVLLTGATQNPQDSYDVSADAELWVGNHNTSNLESPNAYLGYFAVYNSALTATQVLNNARKLRANDDP